MRRIILLLFINIFFLEGRSHDVNTLFSAQDPKSLTQLFAFFHIHKENDYGKKAIEHVFSLINKHRENPLDLKDIPLFNKLNLNTFLSVLTKQPEDIQPILSDEQIEFINNISDHLKNRNLKGHKATTIEEIAGIPSSEIDLSRAIFISQYGKDKLKLINSYEATLDLFALSILSRLEKNSSDEEIIEKISYFLFYEMLFRFPPHSMWINDVDEYTYLPSILDSRHGVCLGVSILYLSIAQRLGVKLSIFTPPGHIYLGYEKNNNCINIETTARGIHMPTKKYLSIQTKHVQKRQLKEVIGLYHVNAASTLWRKNHHLRAIEEYKKALAFMPNDPLVMTFIGYNYLFLNDKKKALQYLDPIKNIKINGSITKNTTIDDYISGNIDAEGLRSIYMDVDEKRTSIITKQKTIKEILQKFPKFREGLFHLGITWLQLGRKKQALEVFNNYHRIDPNNPIVEYYLVYLNFFQLKPSIAKHHHDKLLEILDSQQHQPECMNELTNLLKSSFILY